ncbi:MAG: hypothetical protein KC897_02185 [Candidatus Omnitrophica bacterium]|nr:hypothetical protein [Candidatus Omnitrophota bacterium]MCB9719663.1 hypothetical protein [Candidatus Omnitrophota bacterium]
MKRFTNILVLFGLLILCGNAEATIFNVRALTDDQFSNDLPDISGQYVAWIKEFGGESDIFVYDGQNVRQLINPGVIDAEFSISGNNVAWNGFDGNDWESV